MNIVKTRKLTKRKWLNLFETTWERIKEDGKKITGKWFFASRRADPHAEDRGTNPDAVSIVPIVGNTHIVLTEGFRIPIMGWETAFPAGLLEPGETVEDCARRELPEETGYEVTEVIRVSPRIYSSAGLTDESSAIIFVRCHLPEGGKQKLDTAEDIRVKVVSFKEMLHMLDQPNHKWSKGTWLIATMYRMLRGFE